MGRHKSRQRIGKVAGNETEMLRSVGLRGPEIKAFSDNSDSLGGLARPVARGDAHIADSLIFFSYSILFSKFENRFLPRKCTPKVSSLKICPDTGLFRAQQGPRWEDV